MVRFTGGLLLFTALATARPPPTQHVLDISHQSSQSGNPRKLHGRFLHITDIHPDPFYRQGTDPDGEHPCHGGKGDAGYFGAEKRDCDTPFSLVNATFDWIKDNIKDEIDFVIWTGDSARHDNDEQIPRTNKQVEQLNNFVVSKFDEVFGKPDNRHDPDPTNDFVVPIVPTYGNNDILPHNVFTAGPNKWTRKYLTIWEQFVPQEQRHSFAKGGWFFTEVIPNKLAVFSLNTLYFFDSNGAVDGCAAPTEPGYEHFEWLRVQLQFLRERKMKAILMGHVPPARTDSKQSWDETCYQKYTLWLRQYRDVIVGNIFGHMNLDHFILQDVKELTYKFPIDGIDDQGLRDSGSSISDGFKAKAKSDYLSDLRHMWGNLPSPPKHASSRSGSDQTASRKKKKKNKFDEYLKKIGGPFGERFSLSVISPSVVPNFYPTLRIVEYNITGLEHDHPALSPSSPDYSEDLFLDQQKLRAIASQSQQDEEDLEDTIVGGDYEAERKKRKHRKKKKPKPNFVVPLPPSKAASPGPGYSPQALSFVSWRQLYANITNINAAVAKDLVEGLQLSESDVGNAEQRPLMKKYFKYEVEYDTKEDKVYRMEDLTMPSWLTLAEKIGRSEYKPKKLGDRDEYSYEDDSEEEDDEIEDREADSDPEEDDVSVTKKKKKKVKKRKNKALKKNKAWHTFVRRAFVSTKTDEELEDEFG